MPQSRCSIYCRCYAVVVRRRVVAVFIDSAYIFEYIDAVFFLRFYLTWLPCFISVILKVSVMFEALSFIVLWPDACISLRTGVSTVSVITFLSEISIWMSLSFLLS